MDNILQTRIIETLLDQLEICQAENSNLTVKVNHLTHELEASRDNGITLRALQRLAVCRLENLNYVPDVVDMKDCSKKIWFDPAHSKIELIKSHRALTGDGLVESKNAVEALLHECGYE